MKFRTLVKAELKRARDNHPPVHSCHEGFAVLLEEVDEVKEEVWKKTSKRDLGKLLAELVQVATVCQKMAEDLQLCEMPDSSR